MGKTEPNQVAPFIFSVHYESGQVVVDHAQVDVVLFYSPADHCLPYLLSVWSKSAQGAPQTVFPEARRFNSQYSHQDRLSHPVRYPMQRPRGVQAVEYQDQYHYPVAEVTPGGDVAVDDLGHFQIIENGVEQR